MYLGWCRCHGRHRRASLLASIVETSKGSHTPRVGYIWDIEGQPWRRQLNPLKDADERWKWIRNLFTGDFSSPLWEIHRNQICCCFYSSVFVFLSVTYIFHFWRWRKNVLCLCLGSCLCFGFCSCLWFCFCFEEVRCRQGGGWWPTGFCFDQSHAPILECSAYWPHIYGCPIRPIFL